MQKNVRLKVKFLERSIDKRLEISKIDYYAGGIILGGLAVRRIAIIRELSPQTRVLRLKSGETIQYNRTLVLQSLRYQSSVRFHAGGPLFRPDIDTDMLGFTVLAAFHRSLGSMLRDHEVFYGLDCRVDDAMGPKFGTTRVSRLRDLDSGIEFRVQDERVIMTARLGFLPDENETGAEGGEFRAKHIDKIGLAVLGELFGILRDGVTVTVSVSTDIIENPDYGNTRLTGYQSLFAVPPHLVEFTLGVEIERVAEG